MLRFLLRLNVHVSAFRINEESQRVPKSLRPPVIVQVSGAQAGKPIGTTSQIVLTALDKPTTTTVSSAFTMSQMDVSTTPPMAPDQNPVDVTSPHVDPHSPQSDTELKAPVTIQSFLEDFNDKVNAGLEFLKMKITDPHSGLETRVSNLEESINTDRLGLRDRLGALETLVKNPVDGLVPKVTKLLSVPQGVHRTRAATAATGSDMPVSDVNTAQFNSLNARVLDLERKVADSEFQSQVLLNWADNMYKDHKSLQKQVNFHDAKHHTNELIVGGVAEDPNVHPKKAVIKFVQDKLGFKIEQNELYFARRIGKQGKVFSSRG